MYRTILIEGITTENVEQKINEKVTEMEKESYQIKTMSFLGTDKAVLVFKKGLKGRHTIPLCWKIHTSSSRYLPHCLPASTPPAQSPGSRFP